MLKKGVLPLVVVLVIKHYRRNDAMSRLMRLLKRTKTTIQTTPKEGSTVPRVTPIDHTIGCDPEFFFKKGKRVVGAETVLPKGTTKTKGYIPPPSPGTFGVVGSFIVDGVAAELNPRFQSCRAFMCNNIAHSFKALKRDLLDKDEKLSVCFSQKIKISKSEMSKLDPANQVFGCTPSFSVYQYLNLPQLDTVDAREYRVRAAGGHIHLGGDGVKNLAKRDIDGVVKLLDIIVGNTCVLVDRDKGNIERRKLYGRAGEYRLPPHGLEYRTPSNFWLQNAYLTSMVFGLARLALSIASNPLAKKLIMEAVVQDDIVKAINTNSYSLALKNFDKITPLLRRMTECSYGGYGLTDENLYLFKHFHSMIKEHGIEYWFKETPIAHWVGFTEGHSYGFNTYLCDAVQEDYNNNYNEKKA